MHRIPAGEKGETGKRFGTKRQKGKRFEQKWEKGKALKKMGSREKDLVQRGKRGKVRTHMQSHRLEPQDLSDAISASEKGASTRRRGKSNRLCEYGVAFKSALRPGAPSGAPGAPLGAPMSSMELRPVPAGAETCITVGNDRNLLVGKDKIRSDVDLATHPGVQTGSNRNLL